MLRAIDKTIPLKAFLPFTKYHGLGNDFVLIDARELVFDPALLPLFRNWRLVIKYLAPIMCDRHHGIGADGVILAMPLYSSSDVHDVFDRSGYPARHGTTREEDQADAPAVQYRQAVAALTASYPQVETCQLSWVYTNSDGSDAHMCGNGLRCLALWARLRGQVFKSGKKDERFSGGSERARADLILIRIATAKGVVSVTLKCSDCKKHGAERISVDVGKPILDPSSIPVSTNSVTALELVPTKVGDHGSFVRMQLNLNGRNVSAVAVSMGNPHCVIFDESIWEGWRSQPPPQSQSGAEAPVSALKEPDQLEGHLRDGLQSLARTIQTDPVFPEGANVEFVQLLSMERARCYVYERGCGFTLACASGATAVVVAGVLEGKLQRKAFVELPGGSFEINWSEADNCLTITGPAHEVFSGVFPLEGLDESPSLAERKQEAHCQ